MKWKIIILLLISTYSFSTELLPIYITPFYNSEPLSINAENYSEKLMTTNTNELYKTSLEIKKNIKVCINVENII